MNNVGVDHGSFYIFVSEEFLNGTNVITILEKMCSKRMAKDVRGDMFGNIEGQCSLPDGFLQNTWVKMMSFGPFGNRIC